MNRFNFLNLAKAGRGESTKSTVLGLLAIIGTLASSALIARAFEIDWFTIDGGGGTSVGGSFSVSGTVGQPDAGHLEGGSFEVSGGFWGVVEVIQTPEAPRLTVARGSSGVVTVSWTLPDDGWVLHESETLGQPPSPWVAVPVGTYQSDATRRFITIPNPSGTRFFRLQHP